MKDRRRVAVVLAGAAAFLSLYAPQSLMPLLHAWLGANAALAGLIVSAGTFGVAVAAPFAGLLADRIGRQRVIVLAAFIVVLPTAAVALAQSPTQLIVARLLQGIFLPGIFGVTVAYIGSEWPQQQARKVTALYVAGTIGGGFCGRFTSGLVAEFAGWHWGFGVLAFGQLLLAIAIRAWLPPQRERVRSISTPLATMRALLRRAELRGAYAVGFSLLFALVGGFTYVTLRLAEPPFSLGPAALSAIFAVYLISVFVTPFSGKLLNRYGHARVLMIAWSITVSGLALSLLPHLMSMIAALTLFSAGLFIAQTAATSFVAEASGDARATSVGLYVLFYYLGGSVGGVLPAPLWMHFGWPGVAALIVAVGALSVTIGWRSFRFALRPAADAPAPLPEAGGEAP
ncbi:MFS transporter [Hydrocarboniphaga sp.]|uniref:MFS transporter n=1 Tax=Hydrocarboniphaga sp. TaxID=2033016 RepID=UPI003D0D0370